MASFCAMPSAINISVSKARFSMLQMTLTTSVRLRFIYRNFRKQRMLHSQQSVSVKQSLLRTFPSLSVFFKTHVIFIKFFSKVVCYSGMRANEKKYTFPIVDKNGCARDLFTHKY